MQAGKDGGEEERKKERKEGRAKARPLQVGGPPAGQEGAGLKTRHYNPLLRPVTTAELLELFLEGGELGLQSGELVAEGLELGFEGGNAGGFRGMRGMYLLRVRGGGRGCGGGCGFAGLGSAEEEVGVADFLGAGLAREQSDERRLALHEALEGRVDFAEVGKGMHALGAAAQFTGSLRTAEEEFAENGDVRSEKIERFLEAVLEFGDARIGGGGAGVAELIKGAKSGADGVFVEGHEGIAVGFLVAGVDEGVERERVVLGRGDFFFDEGAEDAGLYFRECGKHGGMIAEESGE